jgi:hypothetical protein
MPSVVIVTEQCYLLAEAINFIVINECDEPQEDRECMLDSPEHRRPTSRKKKKKRQTQAQKDREIRDYIQERKPFKIIINFVAKGAPQNTGGHMSKSRDDDSGVSIRVMGLRRTLRVFRDIVRQLREQIPDEKFLDTLVEEFLAGTEDESANIDKMELR